jgi:hypothetical protein
VDSSVFSVFLILSELADLSVSGSGGFDLGGSVFFLELLVSGLSSSWFVSSELLGVSFLVRMRVWNLIEKK